MQLSERTLQMCEGYMSLLNKGYSIAQIAKEYGISEPTIYRRLDFIAAINGVNRSELLHHPHHNSDSPPSQSLQFRANRFHLDKNFPARLEAARSTICSLQTNLKTILEEEAN